LPLRHGYHEAARFLRATPLLKDVVVHVSIYAASYAVSYAFPHSQKKHRGASHTARAKPSGRKQAYATPTRFDDDRRHHHHEAARRRPAPPRGNPDVIRTYVRMTTAVAPTTHPHGRRNASDAVLMRFAAPMPEKGTLGRLSWPRGFPHGRFG